MRKSDACYGPSLGMFGLFCALTFSPANSAMADASRIKAMVGGVLRSDSLPRGRDYKSQEIEYPTPGVINLTTAQYCGDADVAMFSAMNPSYDFVTGGNVEVVLGYWFSPTSDTKPRPSETNWFPLGFATLPAHEGSTENFTPITKKNKPNTPIGGAIASDLNALLYSSGYKLPGQNTAPAYKLYTIGTLCKAIQNPNKLTDESPSVPQIVKSFATTIDDQIDSEVKNHVKDPDSLAKVSHFAFTVESNEVKISVSDKGDYDASGDPLFGLAEKVLKLTYPKLENGEKQKDVSDYKKAIEGSYPPALTALISAFQQATTCTKAEISEIAITGPLWWEPYPMQLACKQLGGFDGKTFEENVADLLNPDTVPEEGAFEDARAQLARLLVSTAIFQQAQVAFHNDFQKLFPKDRCFPTITDITKETYNTKLMGSLPLNLASTSSSNIVTMTHPEGDFAIGTYLKYVTTPQAAFVGMSATPLQSNAIVQVGKEANVPKLDGLSFSLRFNVRGIGCSTNFYCQQ